ncbi:MAG: PaaI family thioesterase [Rubrivivax sp.]|uniref:PaaI family thioesterase n=1 Tax=Ottowia sp. TaxID=1898956 RepID=UPI0011DA0596|nr:PaaI family thioesterase [Ottowia sp.]MCC6812592.1 PaaI family thioesterase [Rubrivivax sp.]MCZ2089586.1 PaaI family thioesterase [Burkholderiales bacterium]TXI17242.1 MAG: PaaI family thioesterase [Ottowia sp.]HNE60452.1 PaaI family thioesterase [Ottowia sp.]HNI86235.1 PaaI family thioesterase [Ottowia sp.]
MPTLDLPALQQLIQPLLPGLLGVRLTEATAERVRAEMTVRPELCTTGHVLHGGSHMALADTLGAIGTVLNLRPGQRTVTTDSSTKFIAGAAEGSVVTAEAVALHRGRSTQVWQTTIRNAEGRLCAVVTQTQLVLATPGE